MRKTYIVTYKIIVKAENEAEAVYFAGINPIHNDVKDLIIEKKLDVKVYIKDTST